MPSQWDHKADKDLLLTIIEEGNLSHIDWQSISAKLRSKDYTFSHEACRQHYQKIRKESRNASATPTKGGFSTPTKSTPSAKATSSARPKLGKSVTMSSSNSNEDDDEDLMQTPSVKRKRSTKDKEELPEMGGFMGQTATQFKLEDPAGGHGRDYDTAIDLADDGIYAV